MHGRMNEMQAQGLQDDGSMDPDDDLGSDDAKEDHMSNVFHSAHAHMHSIPHVQHQMGQPVPGTPLLVTQPHLSLHTCSAYALDEHIMID